MYVCICNRVTERDIRQAAQAGCSGVAELTMRTGCGSTCGSCLPMACDLLNAERAASLGALPAPGPIEIASAA
ncbi:MAG: (2Fe-2S)-binding protein [Luteimonas sp.]